MAGCFQTLPVRNPFSGSQISSTPEIPTSCTLKCGQEEWSLSSSLVCDKSAVLQQVFTNVNKSYGFGFKSSGPSITIDSADPEAVEAVVNYIKSSELVLNKPSDGKLTHADKLMQCAKIYVLADNLQIPGLKQMVLEEFEATGNTCIFSTLDVTTTKDLVKYIHSNTTPNDIGLRLAVVKVAAAYHQKYLEVHDSVLTNKKVKETWQPELYKMLFQYQSHFPELDSLLTSEAPQAWELARTYEKLLHEQRELYNPGTWLFGKKPAQSPKFGFARP